MSKNRFEKSWRFVIFSVAFWRILIQKWLIGIYRKTGPTKSTVLGPRPPPWEKVKIYRKLWFFIDFGVFNRAGKTVSKIGIYALPPLKREKNGFLLKFIIIYHYSWLRQFIATHYRIVFLFILVLGIVLSSSIFWNSVDFATLVFLVRCVLFLDFLFFRFSSLTELLNRNRQDAPKKGHLQAQQQAIVRDPIPRWV
jgi:hypothetical protein